MNNNSTFQEVVMFLRQGGSHSTKELSNRFGVTPRTIQNYVKELDSSGLEKDGTRYSFPKAFRNVDIHERVQMSTALMIALYKQAIPELKESVVSNFRELPKELDAFVFDISFEKIENENLFNQIINAIINKTAISFKYTNKENLSSLKNVYPLKAINMLGYWYLMGYDFESEKIKSYYIKYMTDLTILDESYLSEQMMLELSQKTSFVTSPWYCDKEKSVLLKVTGDAMLYLKRKDDSTLNIIEETDTYLLIKMQYYNDTEVLVFVKKWLPFITIEDNNILKEKLQDILTVSLQNYQ